LKILNLYAGIGGNRKLWGDNDEVTAIEYDENIAKIYQQNFPNDRVIVTDAHQYLLEHFREYDFIWASPPCPSHSRVRKQLAIKRKKDGTIYEQNKPIYPDMKLYQEIILLDNYYDGYYVVENVVPYYEPLIEPQKLGRHLFWSNFEIPKQKVEARGSFDNTEELAQKLGYDISSWQGVNKKLLLRNCVEPEVGELIYKAIPRQ
jgi:DNA (cytosine-5)-methyltransferase 1